MDRDGLLCRSPECFDPVTVQSSSHHSLQPGRTVGRGISWLPRLQCRHYSIKSPVFSAQRYIAIDTVLQRNYPLGTHY